MSSAHYVIDVLGGIAVAVLTWLVMTYLVVPHVPALSARAGAETRIEAAIGDGADGAEVKARADYPAGRCPAPEGWKPGRGI